MKQASRRKYHFIYKTTRVDTEFFYIGMHSTDDLNDGYLGSGKIISASIKKHGKGKHLREILEFLPTREAMKLREKEVISAELLKDPRCPNLKLGGDGGFDHLSTDTLKALGKRVGSLLKDRLENDVDFRKKFSIIAKAASYKGGQGMKRLFEEDEVFRERQLEYASKGGKIGGKKGADARIKRMTEDPAFAAAVRAKMSASSKAKWEARKKESNVTNSR